MKENISKRKKFMMAVLSPANGALHNPVQVQKLFFILDEKIADLVDGPYFNFAPHNYGPFDKEVYQELEQLAIDGYVDICPERTWESYRLTVIGQQEGESFLRGLPEKAQDYIKRASEFVRKLTFTELVSVIYKYYPEMRVNSVFQE